MATHPMCHPLYHARPFSHVKNNRATPCCDGLSHHSKDLAVNRCSVETCACAHEHAPTNIQFPLCAAAPRPITVEALACELQAVLFAQQLILFAPKAIQASKHVPMLQVSLCSLCLLVSLCSLCL